MGGPRFSPLRGVLKLLVEADGSRVGLSHLRAATILVAALSVFAFLGYQPTFFHCKLGVVDDAWASVGSTAMSWPISRMQG